MKIAISSAHFSEEKGGAERYAIGLAKALAEKGHDVHILAYTWYEGCEKIFTVTAYHTLGSVPLEI